MFESRRARQPTLAGNLASYGWLTPTAWRTRSARSRYSSFQVSRGIAARVHSSVFAASFAACSVCFSLRAMFRVCHDFDSVFGFGFSLLCDSRLGGVVVDAMYPLSV